MGVWVWVWGVTMMSSGQKQSHDECDQWEEATPPHTHPYTSTQWRDVLRGASRDITGETRGGEGDIPCLRDWGTWEWSLRTWGVGRTRFPCWFPCYPSSATPTDREKNDYNQLKWLQSWLQSLIMIKMMIKIRVKTGRIIDSKDQLSSFLNFC